MSLFNYSAVKTNKKIKKKNDIKAVEGIYITACKQ